MSRPARRATGGVLHVSPSLQTRGGVATCVRLLRDTPLWAEWSITHVDTHRDGTTSTKVVAFLRGLLRFVARLARRRPVLVHLHMSARGSFVRKAVLFWIARIARVPVLLHVHGGYGAFYDDAPRPVQALVRATFTRSDVVVALGERWANRLRAIAPGALVVAVPNAVRMGASPSAARNASPVRVVFLGQVTDAKGAFVLLRAWSTVVAADLPATLQLAGDRETGRARDEVAAARLAGSVTIRDWIGPDEVEELLQTAHVLVLPSRDEGQPMVVLEAMAHGVCVVASAVGGIPDLIEDQVSGVLVAPDDPAALAAALRRVISDSALRERLAETGRARAAEEFDVEVVWRRFDALYREITTGAPRPTGVRSATPTGSR